MRWPAIVLCAFAAFAPVPAYAQSWFACVPKKANLAHPVPLRVTAAQREVLIRSYSAPEVRGLALELQAIANGTALATLPVVRKQLPAPLLRDRFLLFSAERFPIDGGNLLVIQFRNHPEAMYRTWVHPSRSGEWEIRTWEKAPCSPEQQRFLRITFGEALEGMP